MAHKLTLVSAPAGFGKTTLLSEWLRTTEGKDRSPLQAAWVSLDERDDDPVRFLAYLIAALQACRPGFGKSILVALQSSQPPPQEALLTALVNECAEHKGNACGARRCVLVLDDYHTLKAPSVHEAVSFLLDRLPPPPEGWHLVIASRSDPPLPLARLRGRGQLTELRAADLRFSPDEAAAFLTIGRGLDLSAGEVAALEARTEGWITGLQLAALSLQGCDAVQSARFVESFAGSDRYVLDYLVDEVLSREPKPVQAFLRRTSLLERLCAPLCDALLVDERQPTGYEAWTSDSLRTTASLGGSPSSPSQSVLEHLEAHNLFIVPLDHERHWYRYHRLFADLLRSRLGREETMALYRRASGWCEEQGLAHEAVSYALASGDADQAADLIQVNALPMLMRGELTTLLKWLAAVPQEPFRRRPWLCVYHAWALVLTGQVEAVEPRLQAAEQALAPGVPPPPELLGHAAAIRAYRAATAGDGAIAVEQARRALELLPGDELTVRSVVALTLGGIYLLSGNLSGASQAFAEAARLGLRGGNIHVAVPALCSLADLDAQRGHLSRAADAFREAIGLATGGSSSPLPVAGGGYAGLSALLYEWNDLEGAERHLAKSVELSKLWGNADALANDCAFLAVVLVAQGEQERAEGCLAEAERLAYERVVNPLTAARVAAYRARLHLAQGEIAAAGQSARASQLTADDAPDYLGEFERLTLARVLIAQHDWAAATQLLARLRQAAEGTGRLGRAIEILALLSLALDGQGQAAGALTALEQALSLAEPEGYVRTFVDAGQPMVRLLRQAAAHGIAPSYVPRLLAAFHTPTREERQKAREADLSAVPRPSPLVEPLTEREQEVMCLVVAGLSNQEIADRLVITLGTVKSHTNSIYGKLGVKSRSQAIARAKALGLA